MSGEHPAEGLRAANEALVSCVLREQGRAEAAEEHTSAIAALLEALPEALLIAEEGRVHLLNAAAHRALCIVPGTALTLELFDSLDMRGMNGLRLSRAETPLRRALRGELTRDAEVVLTAANGTQRRLLVSGTSRSTQGRAALAIVLWRDVHNSAAAGRSDSETSLRLREISHSLNNVVFATLGNLEYALQALAEVKGRLQATRGGELAALVLTVDAVTEALVEAQRAASRTLQVIGSLKLIHGTSGAATG